MSASLDQVALIYDDDGYKETLVGAPRRADGPAGLMGRQVAGKEFLDAFLAHGRWKDLVGLVRNQPSSDSLQAYWKSLPAAQTQDRTLRLVPLGNFHRLFGDAPAPVLHFPNPIDLNFAWARQHRSPAGFCLSGLTHTICSWGAVERFCDMVTAPLEAFDTLICTSRPALEVVRGLTQTYADYLRERFGGDPRLQATLELIPLGVDPEKHHPPSPAERSAARAAVRAQPDEVVVLVVGRLSFHSKAHPYPIFAGLAKAAHESGTKVHLVLSGWAANSMIMNAFTDGARAFAPNIRTSVVDSTGPALRYTIWHAADIATSMADNVQETFGLVILEAMACGLPMVATDWNGYKDLVVHGETGFLVPTYMIRGATHDLTSRLLLGELNFDHFLAISNQTVTVDIDAAADAFARLLTNPGLRRQMGDAGRKRVMDHFTWAGVVRAYEELWARQDAERRAFLARHPQSPRSYPGPACYPAQEHSFASYPTAILNGETVLQAVSGSSEKLDVLLQHPLTNYACFLEGRTNSPDVLAAILSAAAQPTRIDELDGLFASYDLNLTASRATIAWLLKYGLLRLATS